MVAAPELRNSGGSVDSPMFQPGIAVLDSSTPVYPASGMPSTPPAMPTVRPTMPSAPGRPASTVLTAAAPVVPASRKPPTFITDVGRNTRKKLSMRSGRPRSDSSSPAPVAPAANARGAATRATGRSSSGASRSTAPASAAAVPATPPATT